jgi:hypothetical protein
VSGQLDTAIREQFTALGQAITTHFPELNSTLKEFSQKLPVALTGQAVQPMDTPVAERLQGLNDPLLNWTTGLLDMIRNEIRQSLGAAPLQPSRTR